MPGQQFNKVPSNDHDIELQESSDNIDVVDCADANSNKGIFDLTRYKNKGIFDKTKYSYVSPKAKYGIGIAVFVLLAMIILSTTEGGSSGGETFIDSSSVTNAGAGAGAGEVSTEPSTGTSGSPTHTTDYADESKEEDPSTWNPTILEWGDINYIIENVETDRDAMLFKHKIIDGITYKQKTFIFMQSNTTIDEINEDGGVEEQIQLGIAEQYQAEFDSTINIKDNVLGQKMIEYSVSRLALRSSNDQGDEIEINSEQDYDDDQVNGLLEDFIGRKSMVKLDKYDQVLESNDEDEYLEQLQEIAPGMSALDMYDQTSHLALHLPTRAVDVGDEWALHMTVKGMDYNGTVTLIGYGSYDGNEVAVLDIQSELTLDVEDLVKDLVGEDGLLEENSVNGTIVDMILSNETNVKDGNMQGVMFWDVHYHFPRYSMHEISLTMEMGDPNDPNSTAMVEFPSYEVIDMYMTL